MHIIFICCLLLIPSHGISQNLLQDTLPSGTKRSNIFSDSTLAKIKRRKFTRLIYEGLVTENSEITAEENARLKQTKTLKQLKGKTINTIHIKRLEVFGTNLIDTTYVNSTTFTKWMNNIQSTSSKKTIEKNIFIEEGEELDPDQVLENERVIRQMPYIKDAIILAQTDPLDTTKVNLTVVTKDIFSYGIDLDIGGLEDGSFQLFNQNAWGIGHEIRGGVVWNTQAKDGAGVEAAYTARNIGGTYSDIMLGYINSYRQNGIIFNAQKPFVRTDTRWGGGLEYYRMFRTDSYYETDIHIDESIYDPINYYATDIWSGYAFNLGQKKTFIHPQLTISGRYRNVNFIDRPDSGEDGNQYFADSKLYLMGLTLSKRSYVRDNHVYGYGITEDIPKGYLAEFVLGYDDNEFIQRLYSHIYCSTGNLLQNRPSYMFLSAGFGTFFNKKKMEQGEFQLDFNLITRQFKFGRQIVRQFVSANYTGGVNRFDQEYLELDNEYGIRGFESNQIFGKKKLRINTETVLFMPKKLWGFNVALFTFLDVGILAKQKQNIFRGDYYSGFGAGIRFKNENLVFDTIQLRFALYPGAPNDQSLFGIQGGELNREIPYDFQPGKPSPLEYR